MSAHASHEAEACRQLWVAVVNLAAQDVLAPNPPGISAPGPAGLARASARAWLRSADFHRVCALAGLAPDTARARIERLRARIDVGEVDWRAVIFGTPASAGRVALVPRPAEAGAAICAVPGCGRALVRSNRSGVCRAHNHAAGFCGCGQCQRGRG
jgi:hypothetical protein